MTLTLRVSITSYVAYAFWKLTDPTRYGGDLFCNVNYISQYFKKILEFIFNYNYICHTHLKLSLLLFARMRRKKEKGGCIVGHLILLIVPVSEEKFFQQTINKHKALTVTYIFRMSTGE